jgi:hypothetical protein
MQPLDGGAMDGGATKRALMHIWTHLHLWIALHKAPRELLGEAASDPSSRPSCARLPRPSLAPRVAATCVARLVRCAAGDMSEGAVAWLVPVELRELRLSVLVLLEAWQQGLAQIGDALALSVPVRPQGAGFSSDSKQGKRLSQRSRGRSNGRAEGRGEARAEGGMWVWGREGRGRAAHGASADGVRCGRGGPASHARGMRVM